jgi:hypothetical protein
MHSSNMSVCGVVEIDREVNPAVAPAGMRPVPVCCISGGNRYGGSFCPYRTTALTALVGVLR